jgi:hypothetical protein
MGEGAAGRRTVTDPDWDTHCGDAWRSNVLAAGGGDICDVVGPSPRRTRDWVAMMRRVGARDMSGVISAVHGAPIATRRAMRGDIVRRGWAIGICRGDKAEFFGGVMHPMADVDEAWSLSDG